MAAWTDDRTEVLRRLWTDGLSCSQIASRLGGITRNSVIGKVHRLGLVRRHQPRLGSGKRTRLRPHAPRVTKTAAQLAEIAARSGASAERQANQAGPDLVIPPDQRKQLLDLERNDCRWPYGTGTKADPYYFCCHKVATPGQSYCDFHAKRSAAPIQPTRGGNPYFYTVKDAMRQPQVPTKSLKEFDAMETV